MDELVSAPIVEEPGVSHSTSEAVGAGLDVHRNYKPDWRTPPEWWEWVSATLGTTYSAVFDPCPANPTEDGIEPNAMWQWATYCNPPGSNSTESITPWWEKAMEEIRYGRVGHYVHCFFNMETTFSVDPSPWTLPGWMVMPRTRVAFISPETGKPQKSPRNRTWFWCYRCEPAMPPVPSLIVRTGTGWTP